MTPDLGTASLKMFGSLILVLGLIILILFLLKKLRLNPLSSSKTPAMKVLGTLNLAPKRAVTLIEVYDELLLIGVGTENVTLISKFDQTAKTETVDTGEGIEGNKFNTILKNIGLNKGKKADTGMGNNDKI